MEILKDKEMVELLGLVHKAIMVFYRYYANSQGFLSFEKLVKFAKDFGLFPDIVPKTKLMKIFNTLSAIHSSQEIHSISH
jgi:hypothetical protein